MTDDGNHLRLPNSTVFKAIIVNYTRNPQRRFVFDLQIDTKADPAKARHCGFKALKALDFVLEQPAPAAVTKEMLYPNIAIEFLAWLDQSKTDFNKGRSQAIEAVKCALEANGLGIPDPITHIRMEGEGRPDGPVQEPEPSALAGAEENDIAPERAVTEMVHDERADNSDKKDLLDAERPEE